MEDKNTQPMEMEKPKKGNSFTCLFSWSTQNIQQLTNLIHKTESNVPRSYLAFIIL
jgi:hypothetical protein